jgi:hypothetical protein
VSAAIIVSKFGSVKKTALCNIISALQFTKVALSVMATELTV